VYWEHYQYSLIIKLVIEFVLLLFVLIHLVILVITTRKVLRQECQCMKSDCRASAYRVVF
jgi:hypothetical protein